MLNFVNGDVPNMVHDELITTKIDGFCAKRNIIFAWSVRATIAHGTTTTWHRADRRWTLYPRAQATQHQEGITTFDCRLQQTVSVAGNKL